MRRFLVVLLLVIPIAVFSQNNLLFNSTSYAFARITSNGTYIWDDWEECVVRIKIDLNQNKIIIYSRVTQYYYIYDVYNNGDPYSDSKGGKQIKFYVVDQDDDKGNLRLRIERNGNSQIYIDFKDCAWCYNVYKIN